MADAQYIIPGGGIVNDTDGSVAQIIIPGLGAYEDRPALTTVLANWWSLGNVVMYTKVNAETDDTNQWSYGNILSFLDQAEAEALIQIFMYHYLHH